ncbi:hypothetical protein K2Z84_20930, partial [Candidatus Binatia bacterium]|nr:hypothetical protein [Candidatus Binatia bacterium]
MADRTTVTIAGGELAGAATWKLSLVGELHGKWGGIDAGDFFAADALRVDDGSGVQRLFAKLPHAVELPGWIFTEAGDGLRASPNAFAQGRVALRARLDDALRRLRSVEIAWHEQEGGFFAAKGLGKVGAQLGGQLTLRFEAPQNGDAFVVVAELSARTTVTALIAGSAQAECSYGFTAILRAELKPRLRLDLDELSIGLPEIPFALDLGRIAAPFELDQGITLQGLLQGLPVKVTATADQAMLAIVLTDGRLRGAVCKAGTPADQQLDPANRAALTVTIGEAAGPRLDIQNLTVADDGDTTPVLSATVSGSIDQTIGDGQQRFGPLVVRWQGAEATFRGAAAAGGPGDVSAVLELRVQRLMLYPADDPEAVLAFSVTLEITPVGARVKALQLLEPLPLDLLAGAAQELSRAASKVLRLLFDLFPAGQLPEAEILRLLDVLSRIAAAVGRAAVFVADQAGEIAAAAGELIGRVLAGIGEVVGALLRALRQLAAKDAASRVTVALYVGTDPLELRQVLVTLRGPATAPRTIGVLGCHLELAPGWRPGLLIDLVAQPGAYLVATHDAAPNGAIATLSTDLWLARPAKGPVQNLPDVDPKTGGRAQQDGAGDKPLLAVALSWAAATSARQAIVLVGIGRGEPVFLQRITSPLAPTTGNDPVAIVAGGAFSYRELGLNPDGSLDFSVEPTFATDRILPLLGMSDRGTPAPGGPAGDSFLNRLRDSLSPVVTVLAVTSDVHELLKPRLVVQLLVHVARLETKVDLKLELDLRTFRANLDADMSEVQVQSPPLAEKALGLLWIVKKKGDASPPGQPASDPTPFEMFRLSFEGPESVLALGENAKMEIAYDALSTDGRGVVFDVTEFRVDRSGLNLRTAVSKAPVRLSGIDQPFEFTSGGLEIRSGRLVQAAIAGRGTLPPALVGDASCAVALVFATDAAGAIELQSATVELDKKGEPIICHGPRFQLTIDELGLSFVRDNGDHFYFVVTGALQFAPKPGEFESGLLQSFKNVRIDLEKVPLAGDARVLARHISFQVAMNPKKRFPLFNLFTFELRGIGFHPSAPKFDGDPAINVSGQIAFVPIGDVMQPKIDFHGLWIAPPKPGQALPRLRADGLGVEVAFGGAAKLRGAVVAVDEKMPTLEGAEAAPPDYKAYGFLGEGQVSIQGFATLSASMGFLEVEKNDAPGERKKAFFLFLQQEKVAYEIPTPVWTFYLREVGFGFGYRYTLRSFREADRATSPAQLISALDEASKTQGELSRFSAWEPDPDGDKLTLALRGAFQMYPAQKTFDAKREARAENPFFFDIVAALRSDLTFLISTRGWLATNYNDFFEDKDGLRSRPGFRGYLLISVPRSELLARVVADSKGYIGERLALPSEVRTALQSVDWSATLYIRPGLLHFELGWPDQLVVRLKDDPKFRVTVRGGLIFRAAEDGVLYGFNVEADAFLAFSGSAGGGSLGVAVEATLVARFVARLISFMSPKLSGSLLYGLISLDAQLTFSVRAWLRIDLRFTSFTITIGYSFSLQLTAVVEIAISTEGVGAKVRARVAICAFGCTLAVGIGFSINDARLDDARARVDRFLGMGLTAETPDPAKALSAQRADERMDRAAQQAVPPNGAGTSPSPEAQAEAGNGAPDGAPTSDVPGARAITATNFWLVLRRAETRPAGGDDQSDT